MNKKSILVFVLGTAVLAGALVFDGVSHRRASNNNQAIAQNLATTTAAPAIPLIPKPDAGVPLDGSVNATPGPDSTQPPAADADPQAQPERASETNGVASQSAALMQVAVTGVAKANVVAGTMAPIQDSPASAPSPGETPLVLAAATSPDTTAAPSPAKHSLTVPAGAVLTIRLGEELATDISEAGQSFSGTLDRDVLVNGKTAIDAGAPITGKVALAKPVGTISGEPTLELKLISVNINNTDVPVVTSIRSFGPKINGKNKVSRFMKGLVKRYQHEEKEVVLDEQTAYSFTLRQPLQIR